jgi:hypothetical protein
MPGSLPKLHPPARYGDLSELEQIFAKTLPGMRFEMASLFGKRTPHLTRKLLLDIDADPANIVRAVNRLTGGGHQALSGH